MQLPQSYEQWRQFTTVNCGIRLTGDYVQSRLQELRDAKRPATAEFAKKYGDDYLQNVINWLERSQQG
ncbi:MAG: hypothetical protein AAF907_01670 [Planctomycetota bacterium]